MSLLHNYHFESLSPLFEIHKYIHSWQEKAASDKSKSDKNVTDFWNTNNLIYFSWHGRS